MRINTESANSAIYPQPSARWTIMGYIKSAVKNNLFLILFSIIYYGSIVCLASKLNIWEDEFFTLNTSSGTLAHAFHQSFYFEQQPPVYFMLLSAWRAISDSVLWARLFNILLIILTQLILYRFIKSISNKKLAICFSILLLLNPMIIFTVLEIRLFALVILLSSLTTVLFLKSYYIGKIDKQSRVAYILLAIAGIFTQYYFCFLLLANGAVLLISGKKKQFLIYLVDMVIPVVLLLFTIPLVLHNTDSQSGIVASYDRSLPEFLNEIKILASRITFGNFLPSDQIPQFALRWAFRVSVLILLALSINYKVLRSNVRELYPSGIILFVILLSFILVDYFLGKYFVDYKYVLVAFVPLIILLTLILKSFRPATLVALTITMASFYGYLNFEKYKGMYKVDDYRKVGEYIKNNTDTDEPIFFYRNIVSDLFKMYFKGKNEIYPIPGPFSFDAGFNPRLWKLTEADIRTLNETLSRHKNFCLIILDSSLNGFKESRDALVEDLVINYKLKSRMSFGRFNLFEFSGS